MADNRLSEMTGRRWSNFKWEGLVIAIFLTISQPAVDSANAPGPSSTAGAKENSLATGITNGITILILGDSLSLCGFGQRLDEHCRQMPQVKSVFTYMACATQPLSWLKIKPYANVKTRCGFWSIESVPGSNQPKELEDVYGMRRGSTPKAYPVPKLDDLLRQLSPDILVMQTGGNLFDLFDGHGSIHPNRDGTALDRYVRPFVSTAISPPSPLKRIYWVASPVSGRASKAVQGFIVEHIRASFGAIVTVIDSRQLLSYPYHHMQPDREHFIGQDMDLWADKVFALVSQDVSSPSFVSQRPLSEEFPPPIAVAQPTPAEMPANDTLYLSGRLVFKSKPMPREELLPYQESLVGFVYDVRKVLAGTYDEKQVLVMHPAHIALQRQSLRKYHLGRTYKLRLRPLEGTPWNTVKRKDDSGRMDLEPYIQLDDEAKYPGSASEN